MGHSLTITYVSSHLNTTPRMRIGEFSSRTIKSAPKCKTETELPRAVWTSLKKILPTSAKADRLKIFTLNMKDCRVAEWLGLGVEALFVQSTSNEKQKPMQHSRNPEPSNLYRLPPLTPRLICTGWNDRQI